MSNYVMAKLQRELEWMANSLENNQQHIERLQLSLEEAHRDSESVRARISDVKKALEILGGQS